MQKQKPALIVTPAHPGDCECCLCEDARVASTRRWPLIAMTAKVPDPSQLPAFLRRQAD
jgi:hypothetical protein